MTTVSFDTGSSYPFSVLIAFDASELGFYVNNFKKK